jgi:hypothetical protein
VGIWSDLSVGFLRKLVRKRKFINNQIKQFGVSGAVFGTGFTRLSWRSLLLPIRMKEISGAEVITEECHP